MTRGYIAVVVGAPDIDHTVIAAFEFVHVVGDVGGEIGRLAIVAYHDAIFFVTEVGGAEPQCALVLVDVAAVFQTFNGSSTEPLSVSERSENHSS